LIATGGTAVAAIGMLLDWGLQQNQIKIISVLGSAEGVKHVTEDYPEVEVSRREPDANASRLTFRSSSAQSTMSSPTRDTFHLVSGTL
jgi:hypothetical protein